MKRFAMVALIMVLALSGYACAGTSALIKEDWTEYWKNPGAGDWKPIKQDWVDFWN